MWCRKTEVYLEEGPGIGPGVILLVFQDAGGTNLQRVAAQLLF